MKEQEAHKPKLRMVWSDKATHFTGALAQNAKEDETLLLDEGMSTIEITQICLQADQRLEWDIFLWGTVGADNTNLDLDFFIERIHFYKNDGVRIAGANQYYYAISNVSIGYKNRDRQSQIYLSLVNRSATSKNAGASGEVKIGIGYRADGNKGMGV